MAEARHDDPAEAGFPLYRRIKHDIAAAIAAGTLKPGDRVASEHDLVRLYGVSRMTANRALRELMAEGVLDRVAGVGTFVAAARVQAEVMEVRNIADEIRARGHVHACRVIERSALPAPPAVAQALDLAAGAQVFHSLIVHLENGTAIQLEDRYVNPAVAPGYPDVDLTVTTANEYLSRIAPISAGEHRIEAVAPDRRAQALLGIPARQPCLMLFRRTWSQGRAVTCAWLTHPGSLYRMVARFGDRP